LELFLFNAKTSSAYLMYDPYNNGLVCIYALSAFKLFISIAENIVCSTHRKIAKTCHLKQEIINFLQ